MLRRINFYLQNYPPCFINKWFPYHQNKTKSHNSDLNILFCLNNISNHFFMRQLIYKNLFLNLYQLDNIEKPIVEMSRFIEKYCESLLLRGECSENEIYIDFSDKKNYLLREYKKITYNDFDTNWFNYVTNEHKYYEVLNTYLINIPYSYVWATHFSQNMDEALVLDENFENLYPTLKRFMTFTNKIEDNKKYKLIFWDGSKYKKFHFSEIFNKLDVNGVCITTNTVFNVSYRTIGWYDLKTRTTGFIKA